MREKALIFCFFDSTVEPEGAFGKKNCASFSFVLPFRSTHWPAANLKLAHLSFPCHRGRREPGLGRAWCPCGRRFFSSTSSTSTSRWQRQQRQRRWRQPFASSSLASSSLVSSLLLRRRARRHHHHLGAARGAAEKMRRGESATSFLCCFLFFLLLTPGRNEIRTERETSSQSEERFAATINWKSSDLSLTYIR